jgi:hypothetical protein
LSDIARAGLQVWLQRECCASVDSAHRTRGSLIHSVARKIPCLRHSGCASSCMWKTRCDAVYMTKCDNATFCIVVCVFIFLFHGLYIQNEHIHLFIKAVLTSLTACQFALSNTISALSIRERSDNGRAELELAWRYRLRHEHAASCRDANDCECAWQPDCTPCRLVSPAVDITPNLLLPFPLRYFHTRHVSLISCTLLSCLL